VVARAQAGPGRQLGGAGEAGHVGAGLGDYDLDREPVESGHRQQQVKRSLRAGGDPLRDLRAQGCDRGVEEVEVLQDARRGDRVMRAEVAIERLGQLRDLGPQLAFGQPSQRLRVTLAGDQRFDHRPPRLGQHLRRHRGELDARVLEQLLQPRDLAGARVELGLAVARQFPQFADR